MRISDWSSDVCSSDLPGNADLGAWLACQTSHPGGNDHRSCAPRSWRCPRRLRGRQGRRAPPPDRKSAESGKSVSVRVDLGGGRLSKKEKNDMMGQRVTERIYQLRHMIVRKQIK